MNPNSVKIIHGNFTLELLKEKVVWIPEIRAILLADLHFGKANHFRKSGIPIPELVHEGDFYLLNALFERLQPTEVYFLGDLFHSDWNAQWTSLNTFLLQFETIDFHLILGNHDILPDAFYRSSCFKVHANPLVLGGLLLSHEPMDSSDPELLNLCGHLHPGIRVSGKARQSFRLACFYYKRRQLILPAFGQFTGLALVKPLPGEQVFAIGPDRVIAIPKT